jgi:elongator complex protein 2
MEVRQELVALNASRVGGASAPSRGQFAWVSPRTRGLVALAAGRLVAVYDPGQAQVLATRSGHADRVNAVAWIPRLVLPGSVAVEDEAEFASAGADGGVRAWRVEVGRGGAGALHIKCTASVSAGAGAGTLTSIAALTLRSCVLVASTSADAGVRVWRREDGASALTLIASAFVKPSSVFEAVALSELPGPEEGRCVLLAAAGADCLVHLFSLGPSGSGGLTPALTCSGHTDWVRSLSFSAHCSLPGEARAVVLASGGQEGKVRLWRISGGEGEEAGGRGALSLSSSSAFERMLLGQEAALLREGGGSGGAPQAGGLALAHSFTVQGGRCYDVLADALLTGHDAWVTGVGWHPPVLVCGVWWQPPCVLSVSMDKSAILWSPRGEGEGEEGRWGGVWTASARLGGAGGNALGLYGGGLAGDGASLIAHSYQGALHVHRRTGGRGEGGWPLSLPTHEAFREVGMGGAWMPVRAGGGHFGPVRGLSWGGGGQYVATVSTDFTTRVWAPAEEGRNVWREVSRPQIHGYEGVALAHAAAAGFPHRLFTGADEKVIRQYDAPTSFLDSLAAIGGAANAAAGYSGAGTDALLPQRPTAAYVTELGLANKAILGALPADALRVDGRDAVGGGEEEEEEEGVRGAGATPSAVTPATVLPSASAGVGVLEEEGLVTSTRWPETAKLYGHVNEMAALAASTDGALLASACRARTAAAAGVLLWDTRTGRRVGAPLLGHTLTPEALQFSPHPGSVTRLPRPAHATGPTLYGLASLPPALLCPSEFLLSVGRDRALGVWQLAPREGGDAPLPQDYPPAAVAAYAPPPAYSLHSITPVAHKRQAQALAVAPLPCAPLLGGADGGGEPGAGVLLLATGGREGCIRLWTLRPLPSPSGAPSVVLTPAPGTDTLTLDSGVTALAFAPVTGCTGSSALVWLAAGTEAGAVSLFVGRCENASSSSPWAWEALGEVPQALGPGDAVSQMVWRPLPSDAAQLGGVAQYVGGSPTRSSGCRVHCRLALGSADATIRILHVTLPT